MDLLDYYRDLLKQQASDLDLSGISFRICFPSKFVDASSNFALAAARMRGTSPLDECCKICVALKDHQDFENISFREGSYILTWNIPSEVWFSRLKEIYNNPLVSMPCGLDIKLSSEEIFQLQYVYTRIHSVYRHFLQRFPEEYRFLEEKSLNSSNFLLKPMKIALNLIKVITGCGEWIKDIAAGRGFKNLQRYPMRLAEAFNELWNYHNDGAEMVFIFPNDLKRTWQGIFILKYLKQVLEQIFLVLKIDTVEELG